MASTTRADVFARVIGILVLLLGIGVILMVLRLALGMWGSPTLGLGMAAAKATDVATIGRGLVTLVIRILLLFLASVCGSMIANKGIHLYFSSLHARTPAETPRGRSTGEAPLPVEAPRAPSA